MELRDSTGSLNSMMSSANEKRLSLNPDKDKQ